MSELIIFAAFGFATILVLAGTVIYLAFTVRRMQETMRAERERMVTALLARTVTEYAVAESRIVSADNPVETSQPRDPYAYEPVGGLS